MFYYAKNYLFEINAFVNKQKILFFLLHIVIFYDRHDMMMKENIKKTKNIDLTYAFNASSSEILSQGIHALSQAGDILFIAALIPPKGFMLAI